MGPGNGIDQERYGRGFCGKVWRLASSCTITPAVSSIDRRATSMIGPLCSVDRDMASALKTATCRGILQCPAHPFEPDARWDQQPDLLDRLAFFKSCNAGARHTVDSIYG
jgi:hypothetical protein